MQLHKRKKIRYVKTKKEIRLSLHVDHTTYLQNPRKSTETLLYTKQNKKFNKLEGAKLTYKMFIYPILIKNTMKDPIPR